MTIQEILNSTKTVAIIGLSSNSHRTSHRIGKYLLNKDFTVIPINPNEEFVFDLKSYPCITDVPADTQIDLVTIFRNKEYTADMVLEVLEWSEFTDQKPAIWTQIGVSSPEAKKIAEENDFEYVENKCIMVEHQHH